MAEAIEELRALSAEVGADRLLVQGAGGNTSLKQNGRLHVKASGAWLADAERDDIFVTLDLGQTRALAEAGAESFAAALASGAGAKLRPSIETPFHALLPQAVVVHVHSVHAIGWSMQVGARAEMARRLAGIDWLWIDYARPGQPLTRALIEGMARHGSVPELILFQNHGIVVAGETCAAARHCLREVESRLARPPRTIAAQPDEARLQRALAEAGGFALPADSALHELAVDATHLARARGGVPVPDHAVFLGAEARVLGEGAAADPARAPYLLVPGAGLLVSQAINRNAYAMLGAWREILARIPSGAELTYLTSAEARALGEMESEKYRQRLAAGGGA